MEKTYEITIRIEWQNIVDAKNLKHSIEIIKEQFEHNHNLDLDDSEIISAVLVEK